MKKLLIGFVLCLTFVLSTTTKTHANNIKLEDYKSALIELNCQYNANFGILTEEEFKNNKFQKLFNTSYDEYINSILSTDLQTLKQDCINSLNTANEISVSINPMYRSTSGSKTINFNNGCNRMTLKYKYSGRKFDTSYKPTATVTKIKSSNYFLMSSYSGNFKNSNQTYTVNAKGKVITTYGVVNNKTFTVNFTL